MAYVPTVNAARFAETFVGEVDTGALAFAFDAGVKDTLEKVAAVLVSDSGVKGTLGEVAGVFAREAATLLERDNTNWVLDGKD